MAAFASSSDTGRRQTSSTTPTMTSPMPAKDSSYWKNSMGQPSQCSKCVRVQYLFPPPRKGVMFQSVTCLRRCVLVMYIVLCNM